MKMNTVKVFQKILLLSVLGITFISCNNDDDQPPMGGEETPGMAPNVSFTTLTNNNQLAFYNAQNLNAPTNSVSIT